MKTRFAIIVMTAVLPVGAQIDSGLSMAFQDSVHAERDRSDHNYRRGQTYLDKHDYADAIEAFKEAIQDKSQRAEGALYWLAYAQNKLGKRSDSLATLAQLKSTYPNSRWLEDAQALELEVKQASGARMSPDAAGDEDMKLLVLNSLVNSDPDRVVPMLEKLLKGNNSPRVKERALFVLAQSHSPESRQMIANVAMGKYNPDLQAKAIEYLGVFGGREATSTLTDIYKSSSDPQIKRAILHGFMISGAKDAVLSVARNETNPELRVDAIHQLGVMGGSAELMQLYTPDAPIEVKKAVLQGLFVSGQSDKILEIARTDKDINMRREAIRQLGPMGRNKAGDALPQLYAKETDASLKKDVLNSLFIQGNAPAIIEIAKKETDPTLKREAIQKLSIMHSKEGTDYLLEILNK
jgi:tetratricopeptide (TPR) repeat protein